MNKQVNNDPFEDDNIIDMFVNTKKKPQFDDVSDIETEMSEESEIAQLAQKVKVVKEEKERSFDRRINMAIVRKLIGESSITSDLNQYPDLFASYIQIQIQWVISSYEVEKLNIKPLDFEFRLNAIKNTSKNSASIQSLCTKLGLKKTKDVTKFTKLGYIQFIISADETTKAYRGYQGPIYFRYYIHNDKFWMTQPQGTCKGIQFGGQANLLELAQMIPQLYQDYKKCPLYSQKAINPFVLFAMRFDLTQDKKLRLIPQNIV